jgi:hypothetical protein
MITVKPYSQNDWRWTFKKVGYGPSVFGGFIKSLGWGVGCTVTALTSLLSAAGVDKTPAQVDDALMAVGGFLNQGTATNPWGSLLIWSAVSKAFPQLKLITRSYTYDDAAVKALIAKGYPVLVNVTWGGGHWVLALGDHMVMDPWDGKVKSFGTFTPVGYTAYTWKK